MITKLKLENFKSFREAELELGPFTMLVGTNASGKSNIRDAFRFLSGLAHGYSAAEVLQGRLLGEKDYLWKPIRGGSREAGYRGSDSFRISVTVLIDDKNRREELVYAVHVSTNGRTAGPAILSETLTRADGVRLFATDPDIYAVAAHRSRPGAVAGEARYSFLSEYAVISDRSRPEGRLIQKVHNALRFMIFFELEPDVLRRPSPVPADALGDHGENLSSVLRAICASSNQKRALMQWLEMLTPMDVQDIRFHVDVSGNTLAGLVEAGGQETSIDSASDGTLRFLGLCAALMQPLAGNYVFFFDEIDTGIHPTRLNLLAQFVEQRVAMGVRQVIATTHSSELLQMLSARTLRDTALTYRLEGKPDTRIVRLLNIPDAERVIAEQGVLDLHNSGWFEDAMEFTSNGGEVT